MALRSTIWPRFVGKKQIAQTLSPNHDTVRAQIIWAAKYESVVHLSDIVFRRTDLCLLGDPGNFVLQECARLAGEVLGWTPDRQAEEVALVRAELDSSTSGFSAEDPAVKVLHLAPTPFFSDRGCHIRILSILDAIQRPAAKIFCAHTPSAAIYRGSTYGGSAP